MGVSDGTMVVCWANPHSWRLLLFPVLCTVTSGTEHSASNSQGSTLCPGELDTSPGPKPHPKALNPTSNPALNLDTQP
jgi:hypothetical protein